MKNEKINRGVYMRGAFFIGGLVFGLSSVVVAEPINREQLNHKVIVEIVPSRCGWKFCRIFPRRDDGSLQQPIDDSTVMDVYRRLWNEKQRANRYLFKFWAADRVGIWLESTYNSSVE